MGAERAILVTGADQHQGLAVIRGLGMAGLPVIAAGPGAHSLGFRSRFTIDRGIYTSPSLDPEAFRRDILAILERTRPALVIPGVESTLVLLDQYRAEIERYAPLAAASSAALAVAVDKSATVHLAGRVGVPAPRSLWYETRKEVFDRVGELRFPVALKPRGNALFGQTRHQLGFKVRYARSVEELHSVLDALDESAGVPMIQECVLGTGVCVSAVFDRGKPVVLFPYRRVREVPLSGGVSVLRESIPLDPRLAAYVTRLLEALEWHGVAMVEFKYSQERDEYTLMEINPRFQASTALSLDAGLNLPQLVASLYGCAPRPPLPPYRSGVRERWLQGDFMALYQHLREGADPGPAGNPLFTPPTRMSAVLEFLRDFRPGTKYDEFKAADWRPGLLEAAAIGRMVVGWGGDAVKAVARRLVGRARTARPE
ncbi:MAG TPA: ATP-grasp domain-containing protein [Gemmatimonadales bacterium]|nr:ATP-grasp domain-containing protein [Gemmatimonadales bacterium]